MKNINDVDFSKISFVLMDLDGVLTDGSIIYTDEDTQLKIFYAHDGFGIERGHQHGLRFGVISGRKAASNEHRVRRLKIAELYQDCGDKVAAYEEVLAKYKLEPENFCFIGDDVFDMPLLSVVGFSCAPINGIKEVRDSVHYVTELGGGKGAVREVIDLILRKQDKI